MSEKRTRPSAHGFEWILAHELGMDDENFIDACIDIGNKAYAKAENALVKGHNATASEFFWELGHLLRCRLPTG